MNRTPLWRIKGFTITELMVALAITGVVLSALLGSYVALQRSFVFANSWTWTRKTQLRVLDSMSVDLRNAISVSVSPSSSTLSSAQTILSATIPVRYNTYYTSGAFAGDPKRSTGSSRLSITPSSTAKLITSTANYFPALMTVTYVQTGYTITRNASWTLSGTNYSASRDVGVFVNPVSVSFYNLSGANFTNGTDTTIVPKIYAAFQNAKLQVTGTMTLSDSVFLRSSTYR